MHNVHTIHGASMTAWLRHADPVLIRSDELREWDFDMEEEAAAFRLALDYANQVMDVHIYVLDEADYDMLVCM